jgi:hypothetical protein
MAQADCGGKLLAMGIGTRQATKVRAEPAANARDEEAHRDCDRPLPLRASGLRAQKERADHEAGKQDASPKKEELTH